MEESLALQRDFIEYYWHAPIRGVVWEGPTSKDFVMPKYLEDKDVIHEHIQRNVDEEQMAIYFRDLHLNLIKSYVHHERFIVKPQFKKYDKDGSGSLEYNELEILIKDFGIDLDED